MQPRTLEIFDRIGVADAVLASSRPYPRFKLHAGPLRLPLFSIGTNHEATVDRHYGRELSHFDLKEFAKAQLQWTRQC